MTVTEDEGDPMDSFDIDVEFLLDLDMGPFLTIKKVFGISWAEKEEEVPEQFDEIDQELNKRILVSDTIEAALASAVWAHRSMEDVHPGMKRFYVTGMQIRERNDGVYQLWVECCERDSMNKPFYQPLHTFLEACYPDGDLTFSDYDA